MDVGFRDFTRHSAMRRTDFRKAVVRGVFGLMTLAICVGTSSPGAATAGDCDWPGAIQTIAGGFRSNVPATQAPIGNPQSVAVDAAGNYFFASPDPGDAASQMQYVLKVDLPGKIFAVAGNGTFGFGGDGSPATNASLADPAGIAVDAAGNLYIADFFNGRIRKVNASGNITTVAGGGAVFGDGVPATSVFLFRPTRVAVDTAGNLYIADFHRIRKVDASGFITTVAGTGTPGFGGDGGPATNASLAGPTGVAVDAAGNLYIADTNN